MGGGDTLAPIPNPRLKKIGTGQGFVEKEVHTDSTTKTLTTTLIGWAQKKPTLADTKEPNGTVRASRYGYAESTVAATPITIIKIGAALCWG